MYTYNYTYIIYKYYMIYTYITYSTWWLSIAILNDDEVHQTSKQGEKWRISHQVRVEEDLQKEAWQARAIARSLFGLEVLLQIISGEV